METIHQSATVYFHLSDIPELSALTGLGEEAMVIRETLYLLNPLGLVNIDRYKKVNTFATWPAEVYCSGDTQVVGRNCEFLMLCLAKASEVLLIFRFY